MAIDGRTRCFALLGSPVVHSLSPRLYNGWFEQHGIHAVYVALDAHNAHPGQLSAAVRVLGLAGVNVTAPFKRDILVGVDALSPSAQGVECANCVVVDDGRLVAHNTDGEGFCRAFESTWGADWVGRSVVLLGAGGAARAVGAALAARGVESVTVLSRTSESAEDAAKVIARGRPGIRIGSGTLHGEAAAFQIARSDLVIQALPVSGIPSLHRCDFRGLSSQALWCDLNYGEPGNVLPEGRPVSVRAYMDGLPMLVHQAALAFALFTGIEVCPAEVLNQLR